MKYTRSAIGLLTREYRAVLKKCLLINLGLFALGAVSVATPANAETITEHRRNIANVDGDTYQNISFIGNGAAIDNSLTVATIKNATFSGNSSKMTTSGATSDISSISWDGGVGGAVAIHTAATAEITEISNSHFTNNTADWAGGAIGQFRNSGPIKVISSDFTSNTATFEGGALWLGANASITADVNNSTFKENKTTSTLWGDHYTTADDGGGAAIFVGSAAQVTISGSDFINNESKTVGGAIAVRNDSKNNGSNSLSVSNSNFEGNKATLDGGAIATFIDTELSGNTYSNNSAGRNGGAISIDAGNISSGYTKAAVNLTDSSFINNTATEKGGAIYNTGTATIAAENADVTFSGNTADNKANDIYNKGSLALTAAINHYISLGGGITGDAQAKGTVSVGGLGYTKVANTLQNQTVTVASGATLQLDGADLTGTTIGGAGDVKVIGDSEMSGDNVISKEIEIEAGQELAITGTTEDRASISGDGSLKNAEGGVLRITNTNVGVKVNNAGIMYSDPTYYSAQVVNTGTATFDGDRFDAGSSLVNNATVNLLNGTEFTNNEGVAISGTGVINLVEGKMKFNNTANSNTIKVASGAGFSGTIANTDAGVVDTRNGVIEASDVLGTVTGGKLYVDANLNDGSMDAVTGTINKINVSNTAYGNAASVTLSGDFAEGIENNVEGFSYYTKVEKDATTGNLVFSDKLVNKSGMENYVGKPNTSTTTTSNATGLFAAVDTLNGSVTTNGSVAKSIQDRLGYSSTTMTVKDYVDTSVETVTTSITAISNNVSTLSENVTTKLGQVDTALAGIPTTVNTAVTTATAGKFDSNKLIKLTPGTEYDNPAVSDESVYTSAKADDLFATKTALNTALEGKVNTSDVAEAIVTTGDTANNTSTTKVASTKAVYDYVTAQDYATNTALGGKVNSSDLGFDIVAAAEVNHDNNKYASVKDYVDSNDADTTYTAGNGIAINPDTNAISVRTGNGVMIDTDGKVALNKVATNSGLAYDDNGAVKVDGLTNDHIASGANIALGKLATTDLSQFNNDAAKFQNDTQVATAISNRILKADASPNIYKDVMTSTTYDNQAVSAGALKQIAYQVGTNMQADQLGWNINVAPSEGGSFAKSLTSTFYGDLENRTVIGALNTAGNAIGDMNFASAKIEDVKNATDLSTAVRALDTQAKNIADNAVFYTGIDGTDRKSIVLDNYDTILGTDTDGNTYNLAMVSKWNVADFGSSAIHMNLNSKDGVATLNDNQVVLTDQLLNKVVAADGNIVMTESDVASTVDGIAHKKYTFSTNPALNATSLALTSTETADAALTMNGTSVNSIDQVADATAGNNVLASKATVNKAVTDSILKADASPNIYKDVMTSTTYDNQAVSAGALKQIAYQVGTNMKADQLGWDINVAPTSADSFSQKLGKSEAVDLYDSLTGTNRTVVGALNTAGDAIVANTAEIAKKLDKSSATEAGATLKLENADAYFTATGEKGDATSGYLSNRLTVNSDEKGIVLTATNNTAGTGTTSTLDVTANGVFYYNGTEPSELNEVATLGDIDGSILKAKPADTKYMKTVLGNLDTLGGKAVSAGAFAQFAQEIGFNMKQDQLGWDINVNTSDENSFSEKLNSAMYNGLTKKTTERTVVSALNTVGNAFEDKKDGETVIGKKTVVESIQDALSDPKQDIVADDVHANTIEADTSLKVGTSTPVTGTSGTNAAAIELDDNDMPHVAAGSEATLATTASLNQAVNNVLTFAGQTFNAKQAWLDGFTGISSSDEEGQQHAFETSFANTYNILEDKDGVETTNMNLAKAFKNIDSNMGKIHGLVGEDGAVDSSDAQKIISTTGTHSNLAKGTSVEMHLVSLDNTIGDRSTISNEKGSNSYALTARTNVADVLSDIASQIGKASDLTSTINGVALTNTVNTNISAVNSKLGDVSTLNGAKIDAVKTSTNAIDAILALDGYLNIDTGLWNNITSLKNPDETPHKTATNIGTAIQYLGLYVDSKRLDVANDEKTATIYDDKLDPDNKATFYTTAGAEAKFYAKDEQLDGSKIASGSIAEGSLAEGVVAKLTKATNSVQGIKEGGEDYITLDPTTNKLIIGEIGVDNMEAAAFGAIAENGENLVKSGVIYSKFAEYKVKDANADEFNVSAAGELSVKEIAQGKVTGLIDALGAKADATALDDYMLLSEYTTGAAKDLDGAKLATKSVAEGALEQTVQDKLAKADSAVQNGDASLTLGTGAGAKELTADKIAQITTNAGLLAGMGEGQTVVSYVSANAVNGKYNPSGTYDSDSIGAALQNKADANNVILRTAMVQTLPEKAHLVDADADRVASVTAIVNGLDRKVNTADVLDSYTASPADGKIYDAKTVNSELDKKADTDDLKAVAFSGKFADLDVENGAIETRMIKKGAVTYNKLDEEVQESLDLADSSLQGIANNSEDYITVNGNNKLKVGKIKVSNIAADAFGDIVANGTTLVKSGTIYSYFLDYAKLHEAANFSSLTLGTAPEGGTLPQATAISDGAKVAAADDLTQADYQTLATNATVRSTVDNAIGDIDGAKHTWTGNNIFKEVVRFDGGINVAEEDLTVAKGDINVTKGDIVVAEGTVQTGSLTLSGKEATAIDDGSGAVAVDAGSPTTLATTATVIKSAQNAKFSAGDNETLPQSINGAGTIHAAIVNVASAVDTNTQGIADLNDLVGTLDTITADYAKTINATTGDKSDPADIATAIQNVATAAAKADGTLNFTEAYTTSDGKAVADDGSNKAADITTAINNVARNAAAAAAGISAEIHGTGTEIAPAGEVKVGNLAATTTVGTVDSNNKLTGMKVSSTATVDTNEDGAPDSKALNIAVSGDGRSTNIDMTETEASMTATNNGRTVGMLVTNDGSDTHTVSLGEDGKYVIEIDTDAKTTKFGKGDGKEVVIGEGDITADKSVTVGSVEGAGAKGVKLDATDGSITSTGNATVGGNLAVKGNSTVDGVFRASEYHNTNDSFYVTTAGGVTASSVRSSEYHNANDSFYVTSGGALTSSEYHNKDNSFFVTTNGEVTGSKLTSNGALNVAGKTTLSADNGMAFGDGQTVKGIDNGATPVTGNGSAETLATTATVMASAENAKYTNNGTGVVKAKNVATLHDAIQVLDNAIGTMNLSSSTTTTFEKTAATDTEPATFIDNATEALLAIDTVVGNVKALDGTAKGNLDGANKSVAEHLSALDKRLGGIKDLGTNSTLAHTNLATTASTAEDGITASDHFNSLDVAMGDRTNYKNNSGSNGYVATNDGSKDLTTMISEVASNIGQFKEEYSTNLISSENTVNANLSALDGAIGNMTFAEDIKADDLTSVINNVDAKLNHSNEVFSKAINQLDYNYRELRHDFEAGMASQAALSALVPNGRAKGDTQLSVGTGMYKGHTAAAVGGFHWFTDNLLFNAGVAWDNAEATGRMGVTYSW